MPNDPRSLHGLVLSLLDDGRAEDALIVLDTLSGDDPLISVRLVSVKHAVILEESLLQRGNQPPERASSVPP